MKHPEMAHQFGEAKEAYNVVLGAMLGGYLALTISRNGVNDSKYFDLGVCLIACCLFVLSINLIGDRFHRKSYKMAAAYLIWAIGSSALALRGAPELGVDAGILATIIVVWTLMIAIEILSGAVGRLVDKHI